MGRAPCCDKVGLKKGRWTAEEDQKLLRYIEEHGEGSWRSLPKNAGLLRCGKSCRLRWINYLRADLKKGNISKEEEEIIIRLHASLGNRWSLIAGHLPGRTDNEIKNYWNSHLSRSILSYRKFSSEGSSIDISKLCSTERKRRRGRTSRSAMKKNMNTRFNKKREREMQQQDENVGTMVQVEQDSGINWDPIDEELLQSLLLEFGNHEEGSSSGDEEEDIGSYLVFGGEGGGSENVLEFDKLEGVDQVVASGGEGVMEEACKVWDQGEELWPWMWDWDGENGWFGIEGMEINGCQEE